MDLSASTGTIPCVFLTQKDMQRFLAAAEQGADGSWGGRHDPAQLAYGSGKWGRRLPLSDFSSWGVPRGPVPEAGDHGPGGNIYSTLDGGAYGSIVAPPWQLRPWRVCRPWCCSTSKTKNLTEQTGLSARALAQALLMSTAKPLTEENGLPYSPRKQGAGLANAYEGHFCPVLPAGRGRVG